MPNYPGVRVNGTGAQYRLRYGGVDYQEGGFRTQREAHEARTAKLVELKRATSSGPRTIVGQTVGELRTEWLDRQTAKPSTIAGYQRDYSAYLSADFDGLRVADVDADRVDAWIARSLRRGVSRGVVRRARWQLGSIFDLAVGKGLDRNPVAAARMPKARRGNAPKADPRAAYRILDRDEIDDFADAIDPRFRSLVYIGAYLGLRPGELTGLSLDQIDLEAGTITVDRAVRWTHDSEGRQTDLELVPELKTDGAFRVIPFGSKVREAIERHLDEVGVADDGRLYYFTGNRARGFQGLVSTSSGGFRRIWSEAERVTGIELRVYDLRHTAATTAIEAGIPLNRVAALLGDRVQTVADHYVAVRDISAADAETIEGTVRLRVVGE